MSLDVVNAADHAVVSGPASLGRGYELSASVGQALPPTSFAASLPPGSQESTTSKHTGISSSVDDARERQLTPTSSQSGNELSSPERSAAYLTSPNAGSALPRYEPLYSEEMGDAVPHSPVSLGRPLSYHVDSTAGQKRTASGTVKNHRAGSVESADRTTVHGRSRTTSSASRSSQVGEMTAQLRARLAYAKVKVQHGWETRTLDEIETITSMPTSPASVNTNSTRMFQSPGTRPYGEGLGVMRTTSAQGFPADRPVTAPSRQLNYGQTPGNGTEAAQAIDSTLPRNLPPSRGSLAPPVDFVSSRKTPSGARHVPSPSGNGGSYSTAVGASSASSPYAPTAMSQSEQAKSITQRTMEQDAIETLLFMSSPSNSANFGRGPIQRPAQAPSGNAFGKQLGQSHGPSQAAGIQNKPSFPPQRSGVHTLSERDLPPSPRKLAIEEEVIPRANLRDGAGIDEALDEFRRRAAARGADAESSDEEGGSL